ncbi:uroporphyrinogen-III synthase [Gymnodinialimonas hymeniacidonis]|uniref:uroporphyrinogen-III synthase n=1 Tax=Gymnodinialimonas hymeniacidonis TaxID=3126508 RepID=UPI0034C651BC
MAVHSRPTLLLTRPRAASERFAEGLDGFDVVIAPLMEIAPTDEPVSLDGISALILTSENAVPFLPKSDLPAYCVGPRTAESATDAGFAAEVVGPNAEGLIDALIARRPAGPLLHVHGRHTRGDVVGHLQRAGLDARGIAAYAQNQVPANDALRRALEQSQVIVPLFSPRSAALFAEAATEASENTILFALSEAVKAALPEAMQPRTQVIAHPNGAEMRKALEPFGMRRNSP